MFAEMTPLRKLFGAGPDCFKAYSYSIPAVSYTHLESVEIGSFFGGFTTSWIYGANGHLGVDLG